MLTPQLYPPPPYNFPLFNCRFKLFHFNFGGKVSQSLRKASYYVRVTYTAFIIKWNHVFIYLQQGGFIALLFVELLRKGGFIYYTYNSVSFPCLGVSNFEPQTCWFKDLPPPLLSLSTATTIAHASNENIIIFQSISTVSLPTVKLPDPAQSALTTGDCECDRAQRGDGLGSAHIKSLLSEGGSGPESCSNLHPHTRILF